MYQMNMEFRSKMQTEMILRPLPASVHSNSRGDVKRLVYALPATKKKKKKKTRPASVFILSCPLEREIKLISYTACKLAAIEDYCVLNAFKV